MAAGLGVHRPPLSCSTRTSSAASAPTPQPRACVGSLCRLPVRRQACQVGRRGGTRAARRCAASSRLQGEDEKVGGQEGPGDGEEEEEEVVDFSQGGWLWTNDESAKKQSVLKAQKVRPKKSLGQNFLKDEGVLSRVVRAAGIEAGDLVLEVGPGTGNLTRFLLAAGANVTSVEKDHRLVESLQKEFGHLPNFKLIEGDILRLNAADLARDIRAAAAEAGGGGGGLTGEEGVEGGKIKVVANLPYYITTDVLKKYLPLGHTFSNLVFMLQEEVAQRFAKQTPGSRDYRYMSVFCRYFSSPEYKFRISRHLYFPKPKVDGAVVDFQLLPPDSRVRVHSQESFLSLVHGAFLHRRKMMKNSMALPSEEVADALVAAGLSPESRAQDLSLDDFVAVHHSLRAGAKE